MKLAAPLIGFIIWFIARQVNAAVRRLDPSEVLDIIVALNGSEFGGWFDPLDVLAVAEIESGFDPDAKRYEPGLDDSSIGLMQILYSTARDRGFRHGPAALFDPVTNVRFGMRQLKWSWDYLAGRLGQAPDKLVWIGSYNAGVGNAMKGVSPQRYVGKWVKARGQYG